MTLRPPKISIFPLKTSLFGSYFFIFYYILSSCAEIIMFRWIYLRYMQRRILLCTVYPVLSCNLHFRSKFLSPNGNPKSVKIDLKYDCIGYFFM